MNPFVTGEAGGADFRADRLAELASSIGSMHMLGSGGRFLIGSEIFTGQCRRN